MGDATNPPIVAVALGLEVLSREELLALTTSALDELPEGHRLRSHAEALVANRMLLGNALSCSDQSSIHADVQHGIILQLSLDALLVYACVCAGARAAADRRKLAVAASIGLASVPSAQCFRELCTPFPVRKSWCGSEPEVWTRLMLNIQIGAGWSASRFRDTEVLQNYLIAWGFAALTDRLDHWLDSIPPDEPVYPDMSGHYARVAPANLAAPLASLASLHLYFTCHPIEAKVVKLLKDAHAAGVGCGRPRVLTSRQTIFQCIQECPLALCASSFCSPALLRDERVVNLVIEDLKAREYLLEMEDDPNMLYYLC